jgi:CubicO group peptidase (beta-lactamase class C family)
MSLRKLGRRIVLAFAFAILAIVGGNAVAGDLDGLWAAEKRFGPDLRGALTIEKRGDVFVADIGGRSASARLEKGELIFAFPSDAGGFRGRLAEGGRVIEGHWIQPPANAAGGQKLASPLRLARGPGGRWSGSVAPHDDVITFFLKVATDDKGVARAYLRNPERNIGFVMRADRLAIEGGKVKLVGKFFGRGAEMTIAEGAFDPNNDALPLRFPQFGATMDFRRADGDADAERAFYPRGAKPEPYVYVPPPARDDGWRVGTLSEVGIDRTKIDAFVDKLAREQMTSVGSQQIHALLIARHGKLVVEEYFHGQHRDLPHDTRSASKSFAAVLVGAAMRNGAPFATNSLVVDSVDPALLPKSVDPRLKTVRVEHLLTMSPGFDCDDQDQSSPGNEDAMQSQRAEPNWWRFALAVPMARSPGEKSVYCSMNPNLLGAVLSHETGRWLPELFDETVARPLGMRRYFLNLAPNGEPYLGGGALVAPRDFAKLGEIALRKGRWNGARILDETFAERMISPLVDLRSVQYGYLWWSMEVPYKDKKLRAVFAGGNGGQLVMAIPDLDLVVGFFGGNYGDGEATYRAQRSYVPEFILPAVDPGD